VLRSRFPIFVDVLRARARGLGLWGFALAAVSAMYIAFWPVMGGDEMAAMIAGLPEAMVTAMGYDRIGTPGGYITSTVYGLIAPALLLVFSIATGARLISGQEEDSTLELELTAPVSRAQIYAQRLAALWVCLAALVTVVGLTTLLLVAILGMAVPASHVLAGSLGLLLLVMGLGTISFAVGAALGRRSVALGAAAALAVAAFMLNAIGPVVSYDWMTAISPFSWYLGNNPLDTGFDLPGLLRLAALPLVAAGAGFVRFRSRDLMV